MSRAATIINFAKARAGIFARGMCMGAADLVPGVSGGTIAFITGIYGRLLAAVGAFSTPPFYAEVLRFNIGAAWKKCDGNFLLALGAGIITAVLLLGNVLHYLLREHAPLLLAFFCGLVAASAKAAAGQIQNPQPRHVAAGVLGALAALALVLPPPVVIAPSLAAFFFGGATAICAMLLPGISGSYILLILGLYAPVLDALRNLEFLTIIVFAAGCAAGMLAFARLLSAMLRRWHDGMISFLIGVMLGALPKLWPWKEAGEGVKIIMQPNTAPVHFTEIAAAAAAALVGAVLVLALHAAANRKPPA